MSSADILNSRVAFCHECGRAGMHVDTSAGEIIDSGQCVAVAGAGELCLMVSDNGRLLCDDCSRAPAPDGGAS